MQSRLPGLWASAVLLVGVLAGPGHSLLRGAYTIDPNGSGSRNYPTFSAAVAALAVGVSGPVEFTVAPGVYKETVVLGPVATASSTKTITFKGAGPIPPTLDASGAQNALTLNLRTAWFRFKDLRIVGWTRYGVFLTGTMSGSGANNNIFTRVEIDGPTSGSHTVRALFIDNADSNTFLNCAFRCGGCAVYHSRSDKNVYDGCEMDGKNQAEWVAIFNNNGDSDNILMNSFLHSTRPASTGIVLRMDASSYGNMVWHNTILAATAGTAVSFGGTAWGRACCFRNNIVVNLGAGTAVRYEESTSFLLEEVDSDFNCYYAPISSKGVVETSNRGFSGSLAQWKAYQQANPSRIPPGGSAVFDAGSIEMDPGLVSMTAPHDIHLKPGSPMIDTGTTHLVQPYMTFNKNAKVLSDFEGQARGTRVDIGADEVPASITGKGSTAPGSTLFLDLDAAPDAGLPYQVGSSLGAGPIHIGRRTLGLSPDTMLVVSLSGALFWVFRDYTGVLDAQGKARARIDIPNLSILKGVRIYSAFVTLRAGAPAGIQSISFTFMFSIM